MPKSYLARVPDFQELFQSGPVLCVVLSPDQNHTIVAATDAFLGSTMTVRHEILGRGLFEVFPDNPADLGAQEAREDLRTTLDAVARTGKPEVTAMKKHNIRRPLASGGGFEERYWSSISSPVLSPDGAVRYIIHRMEDVTEFVRLKQQGEERQLASELLQLRADQSEAGLSVRDRKIRDLTDRLHAADAAQLDLKNSQLVKQTEQLREANASLRELTARLMQIQDEERRRIARELHDSIGQMLVAQGMYLSSVAAESQSLSTAAVRALADSTALIEQMSRELRTTSYLLHPPLLDEAGLVSAIR